MTIVDDALVEARAALERHRWAAALELARAATVASPEAEAERADMVAEAAWWLGQLDVCVESRQRAYQGFEEIGDRRRAGRCAVWLYEHHMFAARPLIAAGWLRRARRSLGHDPECEPHGALLLREAEMAHGRGDLDVAVPLAAQVVDLARRLRSADLEAEALQTQGRILIDMGQVEEGLALLDDAMLFATEGRLGPYSSGKVYCSMISACEELGDLDRAAEWTQATMRWSEQHPFAIFPGICRVHHAVVLKRRGDLATAEHQAAMACDELGASHLGNSAAAFAEVGDIRRRLGDLERAEDAFERATQLTGQPCGGLALLRLAQGRTDAAMKIVEDCMASASTNPLSRARLLPIVVHVSVAGDDLARADGAASELEDIVSVFSMPMWQATALSARARVQLASGDAAGARSSLLSGLELWQTLAIPYEIATARTLLGQALRELGDESGARTSFASAAELFDQIGARLDVGLVAGAGEAPRPAGLTKREVEVLRLIAEGKTNNEVAADLCLSAKTVARHLSNIFTKIGVSSRSAATAFAFEHELMSTRP